MGLEEERYARERLGRVLRGKYRLDGLIGIGGMAAVYRGSHRNGHRVAVKVLHPSVSANPGLRQRFLREGYVANKVDHRGTVRVLDDDVAEDGSVFLVMELLEGETLEARWSARGRRLPAREVVELAYQLLDVLASAHENGVVHRDIKPDNLFLTTEGVLKVLDFGIARLREPDGEGASATRTGNILGTPAFMPPEQVLGRSREIDQQTDLWSVAATMFTLISGQFVHQAETVAELLVYSGSRPARSLSSVAPGAPGSIAAVVDRALSFSKGDRWPSAREMEQALARAYEQAFGAPLPGVRASGAPPSMAASSAWGAGAAPLPGGSPSPVAQTLGQAAPGVTPPGSSVAVAGVRGGRRVAWGAVVGALLVLPAAAVAASLFARGRAPDAPAAAPASARGGDAPAASTALPPAAPPVTPASPVPAPSASPPTAEGTAASSRPPRAPPAPPARAWPSCAPPYTIDSAGRRIPKPECL